MDTINQRWQDFESVVLSNAGEVQRSEMRRAFYAGFSAALAACNECADEMLDDDLGALMIQALHNECRQFADDFQAGIA